MIDIVSIYPKLWWLLRMELSSKYWIVFGFHRCHKCSTVGCIAQWCYVPKPSKTWVIFKSLRSNTPLMIIISQILFLKYICSFS
jgi:hypothetical protein